jgi:regulator of nonsense transcripts 3
MAAQNPKSSNVPAILKKSGTSAVPPATIRKTTQPRLKVVVRRLPPGLTKEEFETVIGPAWSFGNGKVDWSDYEHGKISKELGKPSKPSTAWLHMTDGVHVSAFGELVKHAQFLDSKNSHQDPVLIGPPYVDYAPNQKVPQNRNRRDAREGTIDKDPDFIAFLESLTNPIQKPSMDLEDSMKKDMIITTTPLIEHLREKKAAKDRPSKSGQKESREQRRRRKKEAAAQSLEKPKGKGELVGKDLKVLSRQSSSISNTTDDKSVTSQASSVSGKKRERAPLSAAAKIQRDLGLGTGPSRREQRAQTRGKSAAAGSLRSEEPATAGDNVASSTNSDARKQQTPRKDAAKAESAGDGKVNLPIILKKESSAATQSQPSSSNSTISTRRAFLKHANPSQGITEQLLQEGLSRFGTVNKVEIDRKKGTAWAEFDDPAGLTAAIKAGKVDIANGAVQILNYREKPAQVAGARGASAKSAGQSGQTQQPPQQQQGGGRSRGPRGGRGRPRGAAGAEAAGIKDSAAPK